MKVQILCIFLTNYNSYYRCILLAAINKIIYIIISSVWHLLVNLFASGAVLKLLCSVNYYHPIQEDALAALECLAVQEMPSLQK